MEELLERITSIQESTSVEPAVPMSAVEEAAPVVVDTFANDAEAVYDEDMFDDSGEGAGVEGDLDVEED